MAANSSPIYSRLGSIQGGVTLLTAAADYTGQNINNVIVFQADPTNGSFVQRLRFKAAGATGTTSVARIYINEGNLNLASVAATPTNNTASTATTGGLLLAGTYYCKVQAVDQWGAGGAISNEISQATTGSTSTITWTWSAAAGAAYYRIFVGPVTGGQVIYFTSTTTTYTQTTATINVAANTPLQGNPTDFLTQNLFFGEISLPNISTASNTSAQSDIDYPMNLALPPGWHIIVGLGTTVTGGWVVTTVGGVY